MNAILKLATFTADEFDLMAKRGDFARRCHVELLDGVIYEMNAAYRRHARIRALLQIALLNALKELDASLVADSEISLRISSESVPMPDILIWHDAPIEGPVPLESARIVIEVSDATLRTDLRDKLSLYAAAGVPEYWVVDVDGRIFHQHTRPEGEGYADVRQVAFGGSLQAITIAGLNIETKILLSI
jgi:Uma2 family endonuclease